MSRSRVARLALSAAVFLALAAGPVGCGGAEETASSAGKAADAAGASDGPGTPDAPSTTSSPATSSPAVPRPAFEEGNAMRTPPAGQNHLAFETSPYLLQHAHNPVDWYPWGDEAFRRAKEENKPLLVSIGYSACHWCHVMAHECFEDPEIAAVMNEHFVCVKVDREERPDVDEICMTALQLMGQRGGWPLNVFMTPDREPFFGGTYFPPKSYQNRMGWPDLLKRIAQAWDEEPDKIAAQGKQLAQALEARAAFAPAEGLPGRELLETATAGLVAGFDSTYGGFGGAPKFPPHQGVPFLLRRWARTGDTELLAMVEKTLDEMDRGGMNDQLGGGFHRYSVDAKWRVPHFEKMLYDNAQLGRAYVEAWQITGEERWAEVVRETLDYVLAEMTEPEGGFRSATDADSDGREGVYFVWEKPDLKRLLGDDAPLFERVYGVTFEGDFVDTHHPTPPGEPGMNVLHRPVSWPEAAAAENMTVDELKGRLAPLKRTLLEHRAGRTYPGLDDKILTAWNGLMIGTMAYAGRAMDEPRWVAAAERSADFVLRSLRDDEGRILRTHRGGESKIRAFLNDHAFLAFALIDLYEATFNERWLEQAQLVADDMNRLFADEENGGWFHTANDAEELVARSMTPTDGSIPSGNAVAVRVMLRLAVLTGEKRWEERADAAFLRFADIMGRVPTGTLGMMLALDERLHEDGEIAIVGRPGASGTWELLRAVHRAYLPGTAIALLDPEAAGPEDEQLPLLRGKTLVGGAEAVYICRNYACQAPVTDGANLEAALVAHREESR